MGVLLHSEKSCQNIIGSISDDMKKRLCASVIESNSKFSIMIDESTSVANVSCLVIHMRAFVNNTPTNIFLDLIELAKADADTIVDRILEALRKNGFSHEFCESNFICFASDGASVMTGRKSGVGQKLLLKYPDLILWHCANHRLELAVGDVAKTVSGVNPFKTFMDSLYSVYSQSPKLQCELKGVASDLDVAISKIGRVLDTRWAASSLLSARAVWSSFPALATHFKGYGDKDDKFSGLYTTLTSVNFVQNLAVVLDILSEVSKLSLALQARSVTIAESHCLIMQSVMAVENMIREPCEYCKKADQAIDDGEICRVKSTNKQVELIDRDGR